MKMTKIEAEGNLRGTYRAEESVWWYDIPIRRSDEATIWLFDEIRKSCQKSFNPVNDEEMSLCKVKISIEIIEDKKE